MRAEDMTAEELMELAKAKGAAEPETEEGEVGGVRFRVYPEKLRSWKAVQLARSFDGEVGLDQLMAMMALVELVTDLDEKAIVGHCGGEEAPFEDVMSFVADLATAVFPKN